MRNKRAASVLIIGIIIASAAGFAPTRTSTVTGQEGARSPFLSFFFARAAEAAPRQSRMDFAPIRREIPATAAWIRIFETTLNYPVMRCNDNEYYLTHLPNGEKGASGSIFLDYRNAWNFSDRNTLIYGHNMKNGTMFGMLQSYADQSFYDRHPTAALFTPLGDYEIQFFAAYAFDQQHETAPILFEDEAAFDNFVNDARRRSMFRSNIEPKWGDRLVTFVTCEYTNNDGRLIVIGRLFER